MSDIRLIRLITGELLMADLVEKTDTEYKLRDAVFMFVGEDGQRVGFNHVNPFGKEPEVVTVNNIHVLFVTEPAEDLLGHYNKLFSRIHVAPASIITQ